MIHSKLIIGFLLSILIVFVQSIDLKPIKLPSIVTEGSSVYLECKFDLEGFLLEAVKWRKNRALFYKYQPDDPHGVKRSFPIPGVNVNLRFSNETHVFLENVDMSTQGTYSCDVISKDPFQKEVSSEDQLTVVHSDFLFTPLGSTVPRLQAVRQNAKLVHVNSAGNIHSDIHIGNQGSVIIAPETQKERTVTTTLKKSSTLVSHNHNGRPLHHSELENIRARLSNTIDLTKVKNLNYNQHHDYYIDRDGSRLHFDQTTSKKVNTVDSGYFPVEFGQPKVIHHVDVSPHQKVTTIKKTVLSPKHHNDENILNQKIKIVKDHHHEPTEYDKKPERYEIEEDSIAFSNDPKHHHHSAPGGVYRLSPEQYNDLKFLIREPGGDVVLFKPVSNHSASSTAFNRQPSSIFFNLALFIILFVNIILLNY